MMRDWLIYVFRCRIIKGMQDIFTQSDCLSSGAVKMLKSHLAQKEKRNLRVGFTQKNSKEPVNFIIQVP